MSARNLGVFMHLWSLPGPLDVSRGPNQRVRLMEVVPHYRSKETPNPSENKYVDDLILIAYLFNPSSAP